MLGGPNAGEFYLAGSFPVDVPDGSAPVDVPLRCVPQDYGIRTGTLTFDTNDPTQPSVTFNLTCTGVPAPAPYLAEPGQSLTGIAGMETAYGAAISPDGQHVYITSAFGDAVNLFERDPQSGDLSHLMAYYDASMNAPFQVAISPDGTQLYVAANNTSSLVIFNRDPDSGELTFADSFTDGVDAEGLDGAFGVAVSPDGRNIYVTGSNDTSVVTFQRAVDGTVTYLETITSVDDLTWARNVTVSPDGRNVYVASYTSATEGMLAVYTRDPADGSLTYLQTRKDGELISIFPIKFLNGLAGAIDVTVSPDGAYVYVTGSEDNAVAVFSRQAEDGWLYYVTSYFDGTDGLDGLDYPIGIATDPSGEHLFVTAGGESMFSVFERDTETGLLEQIQVIVRGGSGIPALDSPVDIAISGDGLSVYVSAAGDDAVVGFHAANPRPLLSSLLPASVQAGSPGFTLTIFGTDFTPGATAYWGPDAMPTTFINSTELHVEVPASYLGSAGTAGIIVYNPEPGGGASYNTLTFTITAPDENPIPSISALNPQSAPAGSAGFTLTVYGSGFISGSTVLWNGVARSTTYVNASELSADLPASDIAQPGAASVTVSNPAPGGGDSNAVAFTIAAPGENPAPSVTEISPFKAYARGFNSTPLTVVIYGSNFIEGSVAQWNGQTRPTTYVSDSELHVTLLASDLMQAGSGGISVFTPGPGGGTSTTLTFTLRVLHTSFLPLAAK